MNQMKRTIVVLLTVMLLLTVYALPVQGIQQCDAYAKDYKSLTVLTHDIPAGVSLIVKTTNGTLPNLSATHPIWSVKGPDAMYIVLYESNQAAETALKKIELQSGVEWAEVNIPVCAQERPVISRSGLNNWGYEYIHADALNRKLREMELTNRVVVAVIDSGIMPLHPIFEGRKISGTSMISDAFDADNNGHGTAISGIIAECTQGLPVDLLEVRILDSHGEGTSANAAMGIRYAVENGADIINLSFVAENHVQVLDDAIAYAIKAGCLPVISAGNYGCNLDTSSICPSHNTNGLVVSGCAKDDTLYNNSCFGSSVDLCAPAVNLPCANISGGYSFLSGTSFAAPFVTAAAAMIKLWSPNINTQTLEGLLKQCTRDLGTADFDVYYGYGVLDLHDVQLPQDLTLKARRIRLRYKSSFNLAPSEPVLWTVKDESVVYIDPQGIVYAVGRGTTTVSATNSDGTKTAFCEVTVYYEWWQWFIRFFFFGWIWY